MTDARVIKVAAEIADSPERSIPVILSRLIDYIDRAKQGTGEASRLCYDIWNLELWSVVLLALKQDYCNIQQHWLTAGKVAKLALRVFFLYPAPAEHEREHESRWMFECAENLLILARRMQDRYSKSLETDSMVTEITPRNLLQQFRVILTYLTQIVKSKPVLIQHLFSSPWFLQIFITDDSETGLDVLELFHTMLTLNSKLISQSDEKLVNTVFDELIYALSLSQTVKIAQIALKIVLRVCRDNSNYLSVWCRRYHGIRLILMRWWNRGGLQEDLQEVMKLFDESALKQSSEDQMHRSAIIIQSLWRSYWVRKKLKKANVSIGHFQSVYRMRKKARDEWQSKQRMERQITHQILRERRQNLREKRERELQLLESLPAPLAARHVEIVKQTAATKIQAGWRGSSLRRSWRDKGQDMRKWKAAVTIQRWVRKHLHKAQLKREAEARDEAQKLLMPKGLTDERRQFLMNSHREWCDLRPSKDRTRADQDQVFRQAQALLQRHIFHLRNVRRKENEKETNSACIETDCSLLSDAPKFAECTEKDVESFSSRSTVVANYSRQLHKEHLAKINMPWWKNLDDRDELADEDCIIEGLYQDPTNHQLIQLAAANRFIL